MSLGFGLENIDDMLHDGIPPVFTKREAKKMRELAETGTYWMKAYNFWHAYNRGAEPWKWMNRKQRDWLWKIKDDIANVVKRDMESHHDNEVKNESLD